MENMSDIVYALKQRIEEAEQSDEIVSVLTLLAPLITKNTSSQELYYLLVDAFHALRMLTSENVSDGKNSILTYLLDYLEKDSNGTAVQTSATRQLRECLEEWITQYPERESFTLRRNILHDLLLRFQARPSSALCWTFSHVGYREEQVVRALWDYALHDEGEEGDIALTTVAALGVPQRERHRLLETLHRKMRRQVTQPLLIALSRLADPSSFEVIHDTCFPPLGVGDKWQTLFLETMLSLGALAKIADAHENDEDLQDRIWMLIATLYEKESTQVAYTINLGGDTVSQCDSKHVVPMLLTWLGQASDDTQKQKERNPLLSYRLQECVRPRQIASWQQHLIPSVIPILQQSACQDTHFAGRSATHEMHTKEAAWGILFRMGYVEALGWFEDAVSGETNPYLRGELCKLFACFCLDPLPNDVLLSITEYYDVKLPDSTGQTSAEISVRLGTVTIARSAPSWNVFEALLECGLTFDGQPLLASVAALSDVACVLARKGEVILIVERLVETIIQHSRSACRLAAARALETLARVQELPSLLLKPLLNVLLTQPNRDSFEQSIIASTLTLQPSLADDLLPQLKQWAQERDDELARLAFSILALRGMLLTEEVLLKRLGLRLNAQQVTTTPNFNHPDWWVHIVGLLYLSYPEMFTSLIANLIQTLPWASAVQFFRKLNVFDSDRAEKAFPHEIVVALIERVRQRQTRMGAELDLIRLVAHLIPEELACEAWDRSWQDWLPDARATLADTLGTLHPLSEIANIQRVRLLQRLMRDGHYMVRRAAYRGLQYCNAPLLQQWCWTWAVSDEQPLRLRAAEAWAWLLPEGEQERNAVTLFHLLVSDPEPEVRQATQRTSQERRKRLWAQIYLPHILLDMKTSTFSNAEVLAAWPYAEALKRVGDDTTLRSLRTVLGNQTLPPHIRHWYQYILKETSEGWEKAIKKWPQPANMWIGSLELGDGVLRTFAGSTIPVHYTVWRDDAVSLSEASSWGGTIQGTTVLGLSLGEQLSLQLEDGKRGDILLKETNGSMESWVFVGQGTFPH